jgi:hypothetical protein
LKQSSRVGARCRFLVFATAQGAEEAHAKRNAERVGRRRSSTLRSAARRASDISAQAI